MDAVRHAGQSVETCENLDITSLRTVLTVMANVHIIGAGLSGLACAVRLAGGKRHNITLYESARHAGGRCRSYHDERLGCTIDNGNHLLLSGNTAVSYYLSVIGASDELVGPDRALFPFVDLANDQRWTVEVDQGRWPGWLLDAERRIPGTSLWDYMKALKLLTASPDMALRDVVDTKSQLFRCFLEPFAIGVLNTPAEDGAAVLLAAVLRETFGRGGASCMPRMAKTGLSETFVTPALAYLERSQVAFTPNTRLRKIDFENGRARALHFTDRLIEMQENDTVIMAVPAHVAHTLLPDVKTPTRTHPIVNAHFRLEQKTASPNNAGFIGVIDGTAHWIFFRNNIISVTVSAADTLAELPADKIADLLWVDIRRTVVGVPDKVPVRHRIVKEKRATFAQTPASNRERPTTRCKYENIYLAGDWTNTGLPATIEGSIRSGNRAASVINSADS
jgi:squalene-associated FAD-dependent desaturase